MSAVVVGYDQTAPSKRALMEAVRQAAQRRTSLTIVTAYRRLSAIQSPAVAESLELCAQRIAARGADAVRSQHPDMTVEAVVSCGPTAKVLIAASRGADLLVVGCRGRGTLTDLRGGSVSMQALNYSCIPTMVVRGSDHGSRGLIVAAVDVEEPTHDFLALAFAEAARCGARLDLVHVRDMSRSTENTGETERTEAAKQAGSDLDAILEAVACPWQTEYPDVRVTRHVADGTPSTVLNHASRQADFIVVGADRRPYRDHAMRVGPVAYGLLHHADCPVIVVPMG